MTKNIWLLNHYATNQFLNKSGRHFWFAKYLKKHQYNPTVFCANTIHNSNDVIHIPSHKHRIKNVDSLPFVFVKTNRYEGNDIHRVRNMINFYKNMRSVGKKHAKYYGKPDVIIASSVHPLTLVAGIQLAKTFNIPCICEVRDLWPESMVAYDIIPKDHLFTRMLYHGEKWIYQRADAIIKIGRAH